MDLSNFTEEQVKNHILLRVSRFFNDIPDDEVLRQIKEFEMWTEEFKKRLDDRVDKPKLRTIHEHNLEVQRTYKSYFTGIACDCGNELQFVDSTMMLSSPPQKDVKCFECGFVGAVFVK